MPRSWLCLKVSRSPYKSANYRLTSSVVYSTLVSVLLNRFTMQVDYWKVRCVCFPCAIHSCKTFVSREKNVYRTRSIWKTVKLQIRFNLIIITPFWTGKLRIILIFVRLNHTVIHVWKNVWLVAIWMILKFNSFSIRPSTT